MNIAPPYKLLPVLVGHGSLAFTPLDVLAVSNSNVKQSIWTHKLVTALGVPLGSLGRLGGVNLSRLLGTLR